MADRGGVSCPHLHALVEKQEQYMPRIVEELEAHGEKRSHWAWWAFPTELCGASEPPPETFAAKSSPLSEAATMRASASTSPGVSDLKCRKRRIAVTAPAVGGGTSLVRVSPSFFSGPRDVML